MSHFEPATCAQTEYISRLAPIVGGQRFEATKRRLGLPAVAVNHLSKEQAAHLIRALILLKNRLPKAERVAVTGPPESGAAQPGDLLRRILTPPPPGSRPVSQAQSRALVGLINRIGKTRYREYKAALGIPADIALPRLSRGQAWRLINKITEDLQLNKPREEGKP